MSISKYSLYMYHLYLLVPVSTCILVYTFMRGHENRARWAATRDLPARDASSHGGSGPGMRARAVIRVAVSGFCFASPCLPALPSLLRGNLGRIFGSKIGQKSMKKGWSRYWHSKCRFSVGFLIHLVHFHFKLGQRRTSEKLKNSSVFS